MKLLSLVVLVCAVVLASAGPHGKTPYRKFSKPLTGAPAGWKAGAVCELSGTWAFAEPDIALYTFTHSGTLSSNTYIIQCTTGCSWKTANLTINTDASLNVLFDSGFKDTGYMLQSCTVIAWADGTYWMLHQRAQVRTCEIKGKWIFGDAQSTYMIDRISSRGNDAVYQAKCVAGDCGAWKTAQLTVQPDNKVVARYDSGFVDPGQVSSDCVYLIWADKSRWQHQPMNVTVHLVPSSHNDPGWLETVDEYYDHYVRTIYSGVVEMLMKDTKRTFCGEVVSFWKMWWEDPKVDQSLKNAMRGLVASGQLSWAGAGYVSPDEAIVWFGDNLDLSVFGHLWLKQQFGYKTQIGWQADPFGHSSSEALVWALSAFNGFMFGRPAANTDRINRELAEVWHPTKTFPNDFQHSLLFYNHPIQYCQPWGDCVTLIRNSKYDEAAKCLNNYVKDNTHAPWSSNVMAMFGCDFEWQDATTLYPKVDLTIQAFNRMYPDMKMQYSSPDKFFAAVYADGLTFTSRDDADTMPHQGNGMPWWTGFYTSRPEFKFAWHQASAFLHAAQELHSVALLPSWQSQFDDMTALWEGVSLVQHHDAITGDSKQYVTVNYGEIVQSGVCKSVPVVQDTVAKLRNSGNTPIVCYNATTVPCPALMDTLKSGQCAAVTVFNSLAWTRDTYASIRVPLAKVSVVGPTGVEVRAQVQAVSANVYELVFIASQLPPLGFNVYTICPSASRMTVESHSLSAAPAGSAIVMDNGILRLEFSDIGTLTHITNLASGVSVTTSAKLKYYHAKANNENAWDFSTDGIATPSDFPQSSSQHVTSQVSGPCYQDMVVSVDSTNGIFLHYRLYADEDHFVLHVGAGPFDNTLIQNSVDVMLVMETSINNNLVWYTDSQGLEMKERRYNWRQWQPLDLDPGYPVAANTYPITTATRMQDSQSSLLFLTQNTHGVACMANGEMEIMVHRYWHDDESMMNPNIFDQATFWVQLDTPQHIIDKQRPNSYLFQNPLVLLTEPKTTQGVTGYSALKSSLPSNLHLLSLQTMPNSFSGLPEGAILLRLQHMYADGEGDQAKPVSVDLATMFNSIAVHSAVEYTANALAPMAQAQSQRYKWKETAASKETPISQPTGPALSVVLNPLDIKTYIVT